MSPTSRSGTGVSISAGRRKSFPIALNRSNTKNYREPKTPVIKKGNGARLNSKTKAKNAARLKDRLQLERRRAKGTIAFGVGMGGSTSISPSGTSFRARFKSPVSFKLAQSNSNSSFTTNVVCTKMSPQKRIRQGRIQISPAMTLTPTPPPTSFPRSSATVPPPSTEPPASSDASEPPEDQTRTPNENETVATTFVEQTVQDVLPSQSRFESKDDDYDYDVASLLCLVPLVCIVGDNSVTCYWPCLVFLGLHKAMVCHKRLYPSQKKIQRRLQNKHLKYSLAHGQEGNTDEDRVVVLPLGNSKGCCPKGMCGKILYDVIDTNTTASSSSDNDSFSDSYWKTLSLKKGKCIEGGHKVIRLLENFDVAGSYLRKAKTKIPEVGVALEKALVEMERLTYLDDYNSDDEESDGENPNSPFVSSMKPVCISEDEESSDKMMIEVQPIRFPIYIPEAEPRKRRSRSKSRNNTKLSTPISSTHNINKIESAIKFPLSSQKRNRPAPSISPEKNGGSNTEVMADGKADGNVDNNVNGKTDGKIDGNTENKTSVNADGIVANSNTGANGTPAETVLCSEQTATATAPITREQGNSSGDETTNPAMTQQKEAQRKKRSQDDLSPSIETEKTTATATTVTKEKAAAVATKPQDASATKSAKKARTTSTIVPAAEMKKMPRQKNIAAVVDSKAKIGVASWAVVKPLLTHLGHVFYDEVADNGRYVEHFCRPNGDPLENPNSLEGEDYFTSLSEYRAQLCVHGVEHLGTNPSLTEDALEVIAYWVRFNIFSLQVTGERKTEQIIDYELDGKKKHYIKLLQLIGYKYKNSELKDGYTIPGAKIRLCFSEKELWEHLGKHGLSPSCNFEQFKSAEEQMAMEIEIIRKYHGNHGDQVFRPIQKLDPLARDDKEADGLEQQECTPAANKDALEACTRGPDDSSNERDRKEAMSPRKLMTEEPEIETEIEKPTSPDTPCPTSPQPTGVNDETDPKERIGTEPPAADSAHSKLGDGCANHQSRKEGTMDNSVENCDTTIKATVAPKQPASTEEVTIAEVDLSGMKNEEKLNSCLVNLRKNEIVAHGQLSTSIARIKSFVDAVIESKGRNGDGKASNKSPILYICGNPGTGKTMSTTKICEDAIAAKTITMSTEANEESEKAPRLCHISCPSLQNFKYQEGMKKILERMGMKQNQLKRSPNDAMNSATILILDEVDQLLGKKGAETILKQLSSWAKEENFMLSIIGISNAVYNAKTDRLKEYGMGGISNKLVFKTYRKGDLVKMSQSKIGFSVVDRKLHEYIAAKVANSSGDARQYLDLVEKAIIYCRRKLSLEKLDSPHTKPIVSIRDAMLAIRETNQKSRDTIQSLTSYEKMTLCAGVHLARKLGGKTVLLGKLRELTMQAFDMDSDVSLEEFKGIIERLQDNGLLQLNETERQAFTKTAMHGLLRYPVQFDLQLEDVDSALEDTLMKENFYKRMVERLKTISV